MYQQLDPETQERAADVPKAWETALNRQEDFIEELLGG
jgi:type IV secretion system protein VirD4